MNESRKKYKQKHKDLGLCENCSRPIFEGRKRCKNCTNKDRKYHALHSKKLKQEILDAYGGKCKCCGETTFEFLP